MIVSQMSEAEMRCLQPWEEDMVRTLPARLRGLGEELHRDVGITKPSTEIMSETLGKTTGPTTDLMTRMLVKSPNLKLEVGKMLIQRTTGRRREEKWEPIERRLQREDKATIKVNESDQLKLPGRTREGESL